MNTTHTHEGTDPTRIDATTPLDGRVLLVVSRDRALADTIAAAATAGGAHVVMASRPDHLTENTPPAPIHTTTLATHPARAVEDSIDRFGRLDHLVVGPATPPTGPTLLDTTPADFETFVEQGLREIHILLTAAAEHMVGAASPGSAVALTKIASDRNDRLDAAPALAAHTRATHDMVRRLAEQHRAHGIRINAVDIVLTAHAAAAGGPEDASMTALADLTLSLLAGEETGRVTGTVLSWATARL